MMTWPKYQSTIRDLDASFCLLHGVEQQHKQHLQQTATTLAHWNKKLADQQERIRDVAKRLTLRNDPLAQATPPPVESGGVDRDLDGATSESTAFDQALADLEKQASKSPFLPEWSDNARALLIGLVFSILPALAVIDVHITGFWIGILSLIWWGIASWITGLAALFTYGILCTPPLREWFTLSSGERTLTNIDTDGDEIIGLLAFAAPSTLVMAYKIFTGADTIGLLAVAILAPLALYKIFLD